ncbi:MAG: D-tyrosyl-tRNA(Tyr) deacylase [Elusimicrobiales bacterium]|nr:D-tyrosyl-tRNA(Tyr) deacylase [Elusimicrobiales bacterium]
MISIVQRVLKSSVTINGLIHSQINKGYLLLAGFSKDDTKDDIDWMSDKILNLRIFSNIDGKFDHSIKDIKGEILVVSQFTLLADSKKGRRPDFSNAMKPDLAKMFYDDFIAELKTRYIAEKVKTGVFQEEMIVDIQNDGPVTIILDSRSR